MFEDLVSQSGAMSMLSSVTVGPRVLVDMTTSFLSCQCCFDKEWKMESQNEINEHDTLQRCRESKLECSL